MEVSGFPHQVGGHFGLLSIPGHVCKPYNHREFDFYTQLDERLLPFTARLCNKVKVQCLSQSCEDGALLVMSTEQIVNCHRQPGGTTLLATAAILQNNDPSDNSSDTASLDSFSSSLVANTSSSNLVGMERARTHSSMTFRLKCGRVEAEKSSTDNYWAGQCQSKVVQKLMKDSDKNFLLLEDLVTKYSRPCVIDLKMGTRQYGDDASAQKRLAQTQKCRQSTSSQFGVRLVGMQLFDRTTDEYIFVNKYEGRRMDRVQFHNAILQFFKLAGKLRTRRLIEELLSLRKFLVQADGFRFFSSSLLIAYDGDTDSTEDDDITMKMIDFAHSTFNGFLDDKPYEGIDEGYLLGVDSLMRILTMFHQSRFATPIGSAKQMIKLATGGKGGGEKKRAGLKRKLDYGGGIVVPGAMEDEESRSSLASSLYTSDSCTEQDEEEDGAGGRKEEEKVVSINIPAEMSMHMGHNINNRCKCDEGDGTDEGTLVTIA